LGLLAVATGRYTGQGVGVKSSATASSYAHVVGRRGGAALADAFDALRRVLGYARSVSRAPGAGGVLRRARLVAAAAGDEFLLATFRQLHAPDEDAFATKLGEARELVAYLDAAGVLAAPWTFHVQPPAPNLEERARRVGRVWIEHATFASPYHPDATVPGATRYREHTLNDTVHAWMLRQPGPAPWIVCLHGAGMGDPFADMFAFRAASLHQAGFNVAIPVLPHHGPRGAGRFTLAFPGDDPVVNLHGAAQAIADVRTVLAYIGARDERAVLCGISLGSYIAAAVSALEPDVAGVVVGVPVVDIPELLRTHAPPRFARHPRFAALHQVSCRLDAVTSPISLGVPATDVRRIWAGLADRLVRPSQVARLVEHWDIDSASWYPGGHIGFLGSHAVRRCIGDAFVDADIAIRQDGELRAVA
jgi:pimeloyl-ACP methyl ester carboxylesterase